ncbi:starvation-inducible DNA-binding protein [Humitalea rosea]|uniref:Starvation-inducible DNA-binding protein n=1 Tax=Humitalea rosea TaxID=990373 RepID=A0A2W7HZ94_9PROT|nr:DNA starvation/stationary phase protection protein [Humitalea rosea]PZW39368.1 starvation-inducible DNA-binding protein [Humitalea rosea]
MSAINDRAAHTADALSAVLADTFRLYMKVHGFHWNVSGPRFRVLHQMFEEQYNELWQALDPIAERIRALGQTAPGSLGAIAALGTLPETEGVPAARAMIEAALDGHLAVAGSAKAALTAAEDAADPVTADLMTQRIASHEKTAWMLRAMLSEDVPAL